MIYKLQKKLIRISAVSVFVVFLLIFTAIYCVSTQQLNEAMDSITDRISTAGERFPEYSQDMIGSKKATVFPDFITEETPYSTRFFVVRYNQDGVILSENVKSVSTVSVSDAHTLAEQAVAKGSERGWIDGYRYKIYDTENGFSVLFVDGNMNRSVSRMVLLTASIVLAISALVIITLIAVFSKRAVKPMAESYEKQKQFITDANHELKTPLTLILTNLDIAESEVGKNEWLEDIRTESERMSSLINQLITLSRMDEGSKPNSDWFNLSDAVYDTVSDFYNLANSQGKSFFTKIEPNIQYYGEEVSIRRLVSVLLDNAVKYCDDGGEINVFFTSQRHPTLWVENSYRNVQSVELNKLFERFYRSDKSRTYTGSFGIGLSIAKSIVEKHRGEISAYKKDDTHIGFKVIFK